MWPVKCKPVAMERIWGGDELKPMFGVKTDRPIGEYWVISAHPNGMSVVDGGPFDGKTLQELVEAHPEAYLGQRAPQKRFPLLVKFIEAHDDLSVQVHPDDAYAQAHEGDAGKTEAWYVLDAPADGKVILGNSFPDRDTYLQAVRDGRVREYLTYRPIRKGDLVFVPSRTLHALLRGTKVLEIQQTSDVTYRVYDWDRVDANGKPRELHVEKAADVIAYGTEPPAPEPVAMVDKPGFDIVRLVSCPYFTIDRVRVRGRSAEMETGVRGNPDCAVVVEGSGHLRCVAEGQEVRLPVKAGDALVIPADVPQYAWEADEALTVIRAFYGSFGP
ncbi:type I phosphomannose isomerase catalytic subunit [Alicyclobacillus sendaiensis]|uniref:type I phosphomannose isomerase catalytic subunit n=1 Tax=Alicyclobacillus sendaiensis TaxID=192387 RepID=UPI0007813E14|nr:type I phosphomannose isomerase catalytic subunit [Alicyclobacillus sendaiensis]